MSVRYKDTEYTYISAKVRAMEASLVKKDCLERMIAAENSDGAAAYLREYGIDVAGMTAAEREDVLISALGGGMSEIEKNAPIPEIFAFFRYPYDCSNIKALIKCSKRGIDAEGMLFSIGSVPIKKLVESFTRGDFSVLPQNMAKAAKEASAAYEATKDPQKIDFILDKACFADMDACAKKAEKFKIDFISELVNAKADLTNFMICLRVLRMNCGELGRSYIDEALLDCGCVGKKKFAEAYARGEEQLVALIAKNGYDRVARKLGANASLGFAEKVCDNERIELAKKAKRVTFGVEIPAAYIVALETAMQNVRIVLAGKDAGISADTINERIRECYV
jgi:V/A-type H+-transporting ATPase subunit C